MISLMRDTFLHERETLDALADYLRTYPRRLSMDALCAEFEQKFAAWQGRKHAVLVNSGASANLAIFQALLNLGKLPHGASVGFSALTWATNVMPLLQLGFKTVPIDVDPTTLNIASDIFFDAYWKRPMPALFVTNALGLLPDLNLINHLCRQFDTLLIEDNCESLGSELPSGRAGNFSFAASFSFFVAHHMSTIEGGMVCTDDDNMAEMLRMVRANGWDRNLTAQQQAHWRAAHGVSSELQAKYTFYVSAYNMRPTEITGFLGLQQLKYLDENITLRERHFNTLECVAAVNGDLISLDHAHMSRVSPFGFPVLCRTAELRADYLARFAGAGVEVRPIIAGNIVRQPFYAPYRDDNLVLPGADTVERTGFYCGLYPDLTSSEMEVLKSCLMKK